MNNQALQDYFFFTDSDLDANRKGEFSKKQRDLLAKADKEASRFIGAAGII